jgi:hypothetical protein
MRHGKNSAYGRKARREGALERLKASKFTEKMMADGKERNEKSWTKKKEADIERLEERIKHG